TGFAASFDDLVSFFEQTFYAHQYGETDDIVEKLERVLGNLEEYGFIDEDEGTLDATTTGERVAELYIDPYSAHHLLQHMQQAEQEGGTDLAFLHSLSQTVEMKPRFRVRGSEESDVEEMLAEAEEELFDTPPDPWDLGYDQFLAALKTGMCLKEWIEEAEEDDLMERYNVTPGGIRAKVEQADWLLYACSELCTLKEWDDARS
ncbi:MAG: hypothetical protein SVW77_04170, partial [Candidatus Nanohaloarchaea archaeon]|nr:hypothetical protein [Candidatus Nanohaloarchaea archaeon]